MQIEIDEIRKIVIRPDECIVVRVDVGDLGHADAARRFQYVARLLKESLPDDARFLIAPKGDMEFERLVVGKDDPISEEWFGIGSIASWKMDDGRHL